MNHMHLVADPVREEIVGKLQAHIPVDVGDAADHPLVFEVHDHRFVEGHPGQPMHDPELDDADIVPDTTDPLPPEEPVKNDPVPDEVSSVRVTRAEWEANPEDAVDRLMAALDPTGVLL